MWFDLTSLQHDRPVRQPIAASPSTSGDDSDDSDSDDRSGSESSGRQPTQGGRERGAPGAQPTEGEDLGLGHMRHKFLVGFATGPRDLLLCYGSGLERVDILGKVRTSRQARCLVSGNA